MHICICFSLCHYLTFWWNKDDIYSNITKSDGLFTLPMQRSKNCLVLSSWRCEHNWRRDKPVLSRLQLCSRRQHGLIETGSRREQTVLLVVWTQLKTRQNSLVLSRWRCEQATMKSKPSLHTFCAIWSPSIPSSWGRMAQEFANIHQCHTFT